jgi:hypothetical protein
MASLIVFQPLTATAQVGGYTEHNWTVAVGNATFGLRQEFLIDGGYRHTRIFLGWYDFHTSFLAVHILAFLITGVMALAVIEWLRCLRWPLRSDRALTIRDSSGEWGQ